MATQKGLYFTVEGKNYYSPSGNKYDAVLVDSSGNPITDSTTTTPPTTKPFDPMAYGITPDMWSQLDPGTQAFVESTAKVVQGQYDQGTINVSVNADLLNKAMASAATDPDITAKYGDAFAMSQANLSSNLAYVNAEYAQSMGLTLAEQEKARKDLAEQSAAAGQAYSGFREQAKSLLSQEQSGVIESAKRQLQQQVQQAGSAYEAQFGSTAAAGVPISAGGQTYTPVGGITGSDVLAKKQDILSKGQSIFAQEKL